MIKNKRDPELITKPDLAQPLRTALFLIKSFFLRKLVLTCPNWCRLAKSCRNLSKNIQTFFFQEAIGYHGDRKLRLQWR